VEKGDIRLAVGFAWDQSEGDAFHAPKKGGAVRAAQDSLDFNRSRIEWFAIFSFGTFVPLRLVTSAHRASDIFSVPGRSNELV
jgi:hypothetical protein